MKKNLYFAKRMAAPNVVATAPLIPATTASITANNSVAMSQPTPTATSNPAPVVASSNNNTINKASSGGSTSLPPSIMTTANDNNTIPTELVRRLVNLESIIEKLFSIPGSTIILERKISQFEEMIADFPDVDDKSADQWRDKVVVYWGRLASGDAVNGVMPPPVHSSDLVPPIPSLISKPPKALLSWRNQAAVANSKTSTLNSAVASGSVILSKKQSKLNGTENGTKKSNNNSKEKEKLQNLAMPSTAAVPPQHDAPTVPKSPLLATPSGSQLSLVMTPTDVMLAPTVANRSTALERKQAVRAAVEKSFTDLVDIQSGADVDAVKALLTEVAKAQYQLAPYANDARMQFEIFNTAFRKLPSKMREQFLSIYGVRTNGIVLKNLEAFLQAEIVAQHSKTVWLLSMVSAKQKSKDPSERNGNNGDGGRVSSSKKLNGIGPMPPKWSSIAVSSGAGASSNSNNGNFCKYCKTVGHTPLNCTFIKELLCFNCYQSGHTKKTCTNKPMV